MPTDLVIDLVRHMQARNPDRWSDGDDTRPLSRLGLRQAQLHAGIVHPPKRPGSPGGDRNKREAALPVLVMS